jgi:hypothetical protein
MIKVRISVENKLLHPQVYSLSRETFVLTNYSVTLDEMIFAESLFRHGRKHQKPVVGMSSEQTKYQAT